MIPLAIILLVLLLIALLPVGGRVTYDETGLLAHLKVGPFHIQLYPRKNKEPEGKAKPKREKKPKERDETEKKKVKGGPLATVRAFLPLVGPTLSRLKRRLTVDTLRLQVTWAAADPADAAMGFACASAAMGAIWKVIDENFRVKDRRLGCDVDFDASAPTVYLRAGLSMRVGQAVTFALPLLVRVLCIWNRLEKETVKTEQNAPEIHKKEA